MSEVVSEIKIGHTLMRLSDGVLFRIIGYNPPLKRFHLYSLVTNRKHWVSPDGIRARYVRLAWSSDD